MTATDGKQYKTDCLSQDGINLLLLMLPAKDKAVFTDWLGARNDPEDEQSKKKAYELYSNSILEDSEIGTIKGLPQTFSTSPPIFSIPTMPWPISSQRFTKCRSRHTAVPQNASTGNSCR